VEKCGKAKRNNVQDRHEVHSRASNFGPASSTVSGEFDASGARLARRVPANRKRKIAYEATSLYVIC